LNDLIEEVLAGKTQAVAKLISFVENESTGYQDMLDALYKHTGNAYRIGITGAPGSGKSTLTSHLTQLIRKTEKKVAIIAVDPTSPFSGGALLGDRLRMNRVLLDSGVFIRSMATRGNLGGLAAKTTEVGDIFDAAGYDLVIYETVGVGQIELDIAEAADTTIVMIVPEGGDIVQGMKSGLMEIGDFFVLNKYDRPGSDRMLKDLEYVLHLKDISDGWNPRVIPTIATKSDGINEVWELINEHRDFLLKNEQLYNKRRARVQKKLEILVREKIEKRFWTAERKKILNNYIRNEIQEISPYKMARNLLSKLT
jgi:LAO/AO transport system kinase